MYSLFPSTCTLLPSTCALNIRLLSCQRERGPDPPPCRMPVVHNNYTSCCPSLFLSRSHSAAGRVQRRHTPPRGSEFVGHRRHPACEHSAILFILFTTVSVCACVRVRACVLLNAHPHTTTTRVSSSSSSSVVAWIKRALPWWRRAESHGPGVARSPLPSVAFSAAAGLRGMGSPGCRGAGHCLLVVLTCAVLGGKIKDFLRADCIVDISHSSCYLFSLSPQVCVCASDTHLVTHIYSRARARARAHIHTLHRLTDSLACLNVPCI